MRAAKANGYYHLNARQISILSSIMVAALRVSVNLSNLICFRSPREIDFA